MLASVLTGLAAEPYTAHALLPETSTHTTRRSSTELSTWSVWTPHMPVMAAATGRASKQTKCATGANNAMHLTGLPVVPMCLLPEADVISSSIRNFGKWSDCDTLTTLWNSASQRVGSTFLEFGGNIGACTLAMLLATNVSMAHVFEPNPEALFYMTSTLLLAADLFPSIRDRVRVYPVAVGDAPGSAPIFTQDHNLGNTVLDHAVQNAEPVGTTVTVVRADDVLPAGLQVGLLKMDIQGFECQALDGMPSTLQRVLTIKTEIAPVHLTAQNCSARGLRNRLIGSGMVVTEDETRDETTIDPSGGGDIVMQRRRVMLTAARR